MSKIVYRRYAGLFFCACVDTNDNELAYLEAIHFFVEVLDAFLGMCASWIWSSISTRCVGTESLLCFCYRVEAMDYIGLTRSIQVYAILDEVFLAGEIEETSKQVVLTRLAHLDKLE